MEAIERAKSFCYLQFVSHASSPCVLHLFTLTLTNALQVWEEMSPFSLQGIELYLKQYLLH